MLFAPLSGIFVFQLLVLAGAAKEPVTVATIILGAGATLNALLSKAVKAAEQYFAGDAVSRHDAIDISDAARVQRSLPVMTPTKPAAVNA